MDLKYDRKFEEMKKYIPFLENMIKRLESTGSTCSNPRQAQLDKIRSLRDLLLDKKKRMKMENLLKCEQVLVNLYAKVEQRDTLPGTSKATDNSDLEIARNKFKTMSTKSKQHEDTLPEIARASETEEVCTPGSKEPALFQRRPNKASVSPKHQKSPQKSKRNYTRVLMSPEPSSRRWTTSDDVPTDKPLYSRRSPRRSGDIGRKNSPSYHRKERKKSSSQPNRNKHKDLNITLNVPEESLNSLNTEDILSRIITCSDGDVDIDTLRDLRSQILGELKQTGASEDISDIIMKSYKKKKIKRKAEVEEGELSDSESEAIESIYGSLVLVDKDKSNSSSVKTSTDKEKQSRKIQICLVINSENSQSSNKDISLDKPTATVTGISDFEMFDDVPNIKKSEVKEKGTCRTFKEMLAKNETTSSIAATKTLAIKSQEIITIDDDDDLELAQTVNAHNENNKDSNNSFDIPSNSDISSHNVPEQLIETTKAVPSISTDNLVTGGEDVPEQSPDISKTVPFIANFYKPLHEYTVNIPLENQNKPKTILESPTDSSDITTNDITSTQIDTTSDASEDKSMKEQDSISTQNPIENVEIPLLNLKPIVPAPTKKDVVSEIDILQALKNEILSESITIPGAETVTPALHQPKITKVASSQELLRKKRISIEKYKEKATTSTKSSLFIKEPMSKEDYYKKQSLKLTEKECERFNFPHKLALDYSSEDEEKDKIDLCLDDIYGDLAPKSPETEDSTSFGNTPIIIPVDPVKSTVVSSNADVDMRQLVPLLSPTACSPSKGNKTPRELSNNEKKPEQSYRPPPVDPRVRWELNKSNLDSPNHHAINSERVTKSSVNYPGLTPNMTPSRNPSVTPNMTPSRTPSMTPNARSYEMTPTHKSFEIDDNTSQKHVYAPIFPVNERDSREMSISREIQRPHWEVNNSPASDGRRSRWEPNEPRDSSLSVQWENRDLRGNSVPRDSAPDYKTSRYSDSNDTYQISRNERYNNQDKRDSFKRLDCPRTPVHPFGRSDCPATPTPSFGRTEAPMTPSHPFSRSEGPVTPNHPFGRSDAPMTPSHPFGGRSECPMTPNHPFGRSDTSITSSHPFSRSECPMTPNHPFGRSDAPMTPSHPFGRSDAPMTPSHPFGRSEVPMTPSHPFGRSDMNIMPKTSSHHFGRSDFSHNNSNSGGKYAKDPRLNRNTDYEFSSKYEDDKHRHYKDNVELKTSNISDTYRNYREQSVGRTDKSYEKGVRYWNKDISRRESSIGRGIPRECEGDQLYTRERGAKRPGNDNRYDRDVNSYEEVCSRRNFIAQSTGRTMASDDQSSYRGSNNKNYRDENTLSVKPQCGRSFTIDTSVNRTFQEFLSEKGLQVFDYSFDARKQRATSVGRSFVSDNSVKQTYRESSVGRTMFKPLVQPDVSNFGNRKNFTRARSMGRDMGDYKEERSFKDIKADFTAFSANSKKIYVNQTKLHEQGNNRNARSRKDINDIQKAYPRSTKQPYSPRKNNRDPRMRRTHQYDNKRRNDQKPYGIIYSSDNIARGTILGSGYGVKNYKIPKIKRATEENTDKKVNEQKETDQRGKSSSDKHLKTTENKEIVIKNKIDQTPKPTKATEIIKKPIKCYENKNKTLADEALKKITRSSNKSDNAESKFTEYESVIKARKLKKVVISNSDSNSSRKEKHSDNNRTSTGAGTETATKGIKGSSKSSQVKDIDESQSALLDPNFAMDDLEMFPDNINALIADLDNDIGDKTDKSNQFTNEISLENMFDNICSPEDKNVTMEESLKDLTDLINDDLNKSDPKPLTSETIKETNLELNEKLVTKDVKGNQIEFSSEKELLNSDHFNEKLKSKDITQKDSDKHLSITVDTPNPDKKLRDVVDKSLPPTEKSSNSNEDPSKNTNNRNNEAIVSTTEIDINIFHEATSDRVLDRSSTPDSTININANEPMKTVAEELPDSTNEMQNEMHSDITSTHNPGSSANAVEAISRKENVSEFGSINNLLSMLQDKSKIKELLSMLGNQSTENEKIKKKLEKLSEIVSDEEETNDVQVQQEQITNEKTSEGKENLQKKSIDEKADDNEAETSEVPEQEGITNVINKNLEKEVAISDEKKQSVKSVDENDDHNDATDLPKFDDADDLKEQSKEIISKPNKSRRGKPSAKRTRKGKWKKTSDNIKRVTRSGAANLRSGKPKASRELKQLQDDIREMFLSEDILNTTGIRMCRLAKLVDDKNSNHEEVITSEAKPVVVLEKFKEKPIVEIPPVQEKPEKIRKKPGPKPKINVASSDVSIVQGKTKTPKLPPKHKPGPKSKTRILNQEDNDPYMFESDSRSEINSKNSVDNADLTSSDSDSGDSLSSSKSFDSSEALAELKKKPKRKRRGWQAGVIKKRKRIEPQPRESALDDTPLILQRTITIPDMQCFTDKSYCFLKNVSTYSCRLCQYSGTDIVHHYKMRHPHSEIPLSRMDAAVARRAIKQCEEVNFQAIRKMSSPKYVCIFCFKAYFGKRKTGGALEAFFWHIVSTHTGEYKQLCSECINVTRCPFNLDIPPPPKDVKGQIIGYICEKCNFTQISLENLKTHVIVRHNDEQTEVYTINLSLMTSREITQLMRSCNLQEEQPRQLRSSRSNLSITEVSDDRSDITNSTGRMSEIDFIRRKFTKESISSTNGQSSKANIQSKITFENEDNVSTSDISTVANTESSLKMDTDYNEVESQHRINLESSLNQDTDNINADDRMSDAGSPTPIQPAVSDDIVDLAHFKISYTNGGSKEYVCCINGVDNHYKTSLLISMKRHVQTKHLENWDGYCYVCKLIVTTQGAHSFKECLQHLLDQHMDNFPILENEVEKDTEKFQSESVRFTPDIPIPNIPISIISEATHVEKPSSPIPYINVRPLSELLSKEVNPMGETSETLPKIQNVMSLGPPAVQDTLPSPSYPILDNITAMPEKQYKYEEAQSHIMSMKHRVVLQTMMVRDKLIRIFKCAGRYCYFTTDSAEEALLHASTHQRIGGENALLCAYCDYDCLGNAIDLVTHVFKFHGRCQFVCGHCFYRAAASQLVRAHMTRVHGEKAASEVVLKSATVTLSKDDATDMLSRQVAVKYYVCVNAETNCKFKTFTHGKFREHLLKHSAPYPCYICSTDCDNPNELIQHMKSHDMKLFQCTWCVHGADNEADLLAHASARHPAKQPQAYLRVINSKDGSSKMLVLPLAQYNKSIVPTIAVTPSPNKENPTREAERSIELEKLIDSMNLISRDTTKEKDQENVPEVNMNQDSGNISDQFEETMSNEPDTELLAELLRVSTPPPTAADDLSQQITPVLKTETLPETSVKANSQDIGMDVICLDSDEEDAGENVVDLSGDGHDTVSQNATNLEKYKKVPLKFLYKCPNPTCTYSYKKLYAFKRHILMVCYRTEEFIKCGHCTLELKNREEFFDHYEFDHGHVKRYYRTKERNTERVQRPQNNSNSKRFQCGYCDYKHHLQVTVKQHLKMVHSKTSITVSSKLDNNGEFVYTLRETPKPVSSKQDNNDDAAYTLRESSKSAVVPTPKPKSTPKRKLSGATTVVTPPKKTRYGPQDVDQLPAKPILDELVYCALCEFNSKVRLNLVRHLQCHADMQPVPQTAPVNPVPHLETNEKHFDKMINLSSSSFATRPEKPIRPESTPPVSLLIPPEESSRFPKYVSERQRLTCGATGCSYISVDETMLKCHWETLHTGCINYRCLHCPPYQHLDISKPLTGPRILAHLKMHDASLYACSLCPYYHYRRQVLDKHLVDFHNSAGQVMVVREESSATQSSIASQPTTSAPTMDLKAWQCGLCKFKSMLRQEVIEHCAKLHSSKMQYKCPNCPFRTSTLENVMKHKSNSHPDSTEDVVYYYYREGSVPDDSDGTPRWMRQRQKMGTVESEVKAEKTDSSAPDTSAPPVSAPPLSIDLNLVKKEVAEPVVELSIEDLCDRFGQFCEPNGLKFKCPLCKIVDEDTKDAMQSHLYEELQYRKWGCSICSYKAFHKAGLNDHMTTEHRQHRDPIELAIDANVEKWVQKLLEHQSALIEKTRENFAKQRILVERRPTPSSSKTPEKSVEVSTKSIPELEKAFGKLGDSVDMNFSCPKCDYKVREETVMQDHLESELNKIRWHCSNCLTSFQEYHEAQLHCKSMHPGQSARPVEALRDPATRAAWVAAVLRTQKQTMNIPESTINKECDFNMPPTIENPLLVIRYEERVPTPEAEMLIQSKRPIEEEKLIHRKRPIEEEPPINRKRVTITQISPNANANADSDDERLVIDELSDDTNTGKKSMNCPHCSFTSEYKCRIYDHILRHYSLKPLTCTICGITCSASNTNKHAELHSPNQVNYVKTKIPSGLPLTMELVRPGRKLITRVDEEADVLKLICLICEKGMPEVTAQTHTHGNKTPAFAKKGDVVVKCLNCFALILNVLTMQEHNNQCHPALKINYAYYKLHYDTRESLFCGHCDKCFKFLPDLKSHHNAVHSSLQLKYTKNREYTNFDCDDVDNGNQSKSIDVVIPAKKVARKSTSKLPSQSVAKKSTTKLPIRVDSDSETDDEFSYYGTKPTSLDDLESVTTLMPFYNTMMPFTIKKLSEIIKIDPKVVVKDLNKGKNQ